jgi:hypothetical protein
MLQKGGADNGPDIVWLTHDALEKNVGSALDAIARLPVVKQICSRIRVEE